MKLRIMTVVFILLTVTCTYTLGQQAQNQISIALHDIATQEAPSATPYLNGYRSFVSGQTITYHSSDPDADSALLVRGQTIAPSISWQTDPMPDTPGDSAQFIWLAGIECSGFAEEKESHTFTFLINGQPWFTFQNAKDATAKNWNVTNKNGAELAFNAVMTDKAGDLFGYMTLKVPGKILPARQPLVLEVRGDNSGSADWYMTFQHAFNFLPEIRSEPALVRDGEHAMQSLRLNLDNLVTGRTVTIHTPTQQFSKPLKIGSNALELSVPEAKSPTDIEVTVELNGKLVKRSTVQIAPVRKREIYLLSYSHNDIGYTDVQSDVERKQWNNLEEGMRLIRETRNYPPDARFKWNLETIWALDTYLKHASPALRDEFLEDVKEGSIGVSALYANMLTGLATADEMSHFYDFARELHKEYKIPMTTAVTSDVPGFSWGIVSAMAHSGVKYFATAPNAEDRIGYTLQAWGDKPFYWSSQSGHEKVLTWMAGASYSSFHEGTLMQLGSEKIMKLLRKLEDASYPYDMVQLPYTLADNGPPDPTVSDFVKQWNDHYVSPRLILATHEQMFREFEHRYSASLPVVKGDFTPYWEDGAASTAYETALNRAAVDRLIQGEALWSILSPATFPASEYESAWRNVILYDEHTWGAHNSIEAPDLPFVKQQWETKRHFALEADQQSREELAKVLHPGRATVADQILLDIYNTNSGPRTDVVFLTPEQSSVGDRVLDSAGSTLPSQRLSSGELAVLVRDIPPYSSARVVVTKGQANTGSGASAGSKRIENDFLSLSVDPQTAGINSLQWKKNGARLVESASGRTLNQYLYVLGTDSTKAQGIRNARVRVKENGGLVASLLITGDAPGAISYSSEIRLVEGIDRVDMITHIDKQAVREKEGVHIAFPFSVPGGQLRYDVPDGIVRPEVDQLNGACKNFFSVQSWVDISNSDYGVTLAAVNAPLIEIGTITAEQPWMKSIEPSSSIYSYVMNNYWHTNYKADQEGAVTFTYSVLPHAGFDPAAAAKFGMERRQPLIVAPADSADHRHASLMQLSSSQILVSSLKPLVGGTSWLAYLYNPTAAPQKADLRWNGGEPMRIRASDAAGRAGDRVIDLELPPFDSGYFLLSKAPSTHSVNRRRNLRRSNPPHLNASF